MELSDSEKLKLGLDVLATPFVILKCPDMRVKSVTAWPFCRRPANLPIAANWFIKSSFAIRPLDRSRASVPLRVRATSLLVGAAWKLVCVLALSRP